MGQSKLPVAPGSDHVKAFERAGWVCVRIRGSHHILLKNGSKATLSVPCRKGKDLKRGTLSGLIKDAEMTEDEYLGFFG